MEKNRVGDKPTSSRAQTVAKLRLLSDKHLVSDFHFLHVNVFDLFLLAFTYFSYGLIFFFKVRRQFQLTSWLKLVLWPVDQRSIVAQQNPFLTRGGLV